MRVTWLVWLAFLAGCPPTFERLRLRVGVRPPEVAGVTWTGGRWQGRAIRMRPCPSDTDSLGWPVLPDGADRLPADPDPMPYTIGLGEPLGILPPVGYLRAVAADYCAVDLVGQGPVTMEGEGPNGPVVVAIDLPDFEATGFATAPHGAEPSQDEEPVAILVRVGGTAFAEAVAAAAASGPVEVGPESPEHAAWQALLLQDVAAYVDVDGDLDVTAADGAPWVALSVVVPE